jgi:hypothetical protein
MNPFFRTVLRVAAAVETALKQASEKIARLFLSKAEAARRTNGKFEVLKRKELEAERLDRLRNPHNYQGR